jgi:hypothetical protein
VPSLQVSFKYFARFLISFRINYHISSWWRRKCSKCRFWLCIIAVHNTRELSWRKWHEILRISAVMKYIKAVPFICWTAEQQTFRRQKLVKYRARASSTGTIENRQHGRILKDSGQKRHYLFINTSIKCVTSLSGTVATYVRKLSIVSANIATAIFKVRFFNIRRVLCLTPAARIFGQGLH